MDSLFFLLVEFHFVFFLNMFLFGKGKKEEKKFF